MIRRHVRRLHDFVRPHAPQFLRYVAGGVGAVLCEVGSFQVMLMAGVHYAVAGIISGVIGTVAAFLFQKYFVFKKKEKFGKHSVRYAILTAWNFIAQNAILIAGVELLGVHPTIVKIFAIACSVSWNFLLYKFFVYV